MTNVSLGRYGHGSGRYIEDGLHPGSSQEAHRCRRVNPYASGAAYRFPPRATRPVMAGRAPRPRRPGADPLVFSGASMSPPRNRPGPRTLEAIRMPKLLVDQEWYEPTQPHAVVDTAYESLLVTRAGVLYPGFATVPFRLRISNDRGMSSPHLALVDTAYRGWWLVLLETGPAPTADYVTKQAEVLRAERYGRDVARLLAQRNTVLEAEI